MNPADDDGRREFEAHDAPARHALSGATDDRRDAVAAFILHFVKAILKTGYYEADHPETRKARAGLFFSLQKALEQNEFISVTVVQIDGRDTVVVGGILDEPASLSTFLRHGGAEVFAPRVREILSRKGVFSLSIIRGVVEPDFAFLVDLLSRASAPDPTGDAGLAFVRSLEEARIGRIHVIPVREANRARRRLHWRVQILLSRITRDLRHVPIVRGYTPEQLVELYESVIRDLFRPIKDLILLRDALMNLDVVVEDLAGIEGLDPVAVAARAVPRRFLADLLPELVLQRTGERSRVGAAVLESQAEVASRAALTMIDRLIDENDREAYSVLEQMFRAGVVRFERLPVRLRARIAAERLAESHLREPALLLGRLKSCAAAEECGRLIEAFVIADYLVRKGRIPEARVLIDAIFALREQAAAADGMFARTFEAGLELLRTDENLRALKPFISSPRKEERTAAVSVAGALGPGTAALVVEVMATTADKWVRKTAIESLKRMGPDAVPAAKDALFDPSASWFVKRNLLSVLAASGGNTATPLVEQFTGDPHPKVREAALDAVALLSGESAEPALLDALKDTDEAVKRKAISLLTVIGSTDPRLLDALRAILSPDADESGDGLRLAAVETTCRLMEEGDPSADPERILVDALGLEKGFLDKIVARVKGTGRENVKTAIAMCLGRHGSPGTKPYLEKLAANPSPAVSAAAKRALNELARRG